MKKACLKISCLVLICGIGGVACAALAADKEKKAAANYVIQEVIPVKGQTASVTPEPSGEAYERVKEKLPLKYIDSLAANTEAVELSSVAKVDPAEKIDMETVNLIRSMPARSMIHILTANAATLAECFYGQEITPAVFSRMENISFSEGCTTQLAALRYVKVLHYGFDGQIYIGELVVNQLVEKDVIEIFKELFDAEYPIEQMVLVDEFNAEDEQSMEANNTSSFNFRYVEGTTSLSMHAYGLAIDINPLYNPQVKEADGQIVCAPETALTYADRTSDCEYYIKRDDVVYNAFTKRGFTWGGDWNSSKDYQHFQKVFQ